MKFIIFSLVAGIISFTACKKKEEKAPDPESVREASFKIAGNTYTDSKPYVGIFNNNGTIHNSLQLKAANGSEIEFNFTGNAPATYQLQSYSNAYYKNASGKQYNSTSGQLIISSYSSDGVYKMSGTFHFRAKAITTPYDSIEVTDGVITNASNEF